MSDYMIRRECGTCSVCCGGYLEGNIHGHPMFRGRPCFFLGKGCTIYNNRPHDPCQLYQCGWLENEDIPEWMKPELSKVIATKRTYPGREDLTHYEFIEAGQTISAEALNWIVQWAISTGTNVIYAVDGKHHRLGTPEFNRAVFPTGNATNQKPVPGKVIPLKPVPPPLVDIDP